ncbi:hypothetical protein CEXT_95421 [Caerostris extrusa]|uniref:Uncharacterized protein n=1 Tax=Caerostris extrusa TaxID=172846 RepID=A0AAV4UVD0_CAEEX|nr:hypothetical protein CEXT_95421 [Caerostris extrusa]
MRCTEDAPSDINAAKSGVDIFSAGIKFVVPEGASSGWTASEEFWQIVLDVVVVFLNGSTAPEDIGDLHGHGPFAKSIGLLVENTPC